MLNDRKSESGAALVTVILISVLLGTACIALLTAVGASSRNGTDALSEYKAYYAAESGLQATINVLRNNGVSYSQAVANADLSDASVAGGLSYTGADVIVSPDARFHIRVEDPDAARPYIMKTAGSFKAVAGSVADSTNPLIPKICIPTCVGAIRTEISLSAVTNTTVSFAAPKANPSLGTFTVTKYKNGVVDPTGGAPVPTGITFRIEYQLISPRPASRTIRGTIAASTATNPVVLSFQTEDYTLSGSDVELCASSLSVAPGNSTDGRCVNFASYSFANGDPPKVLYADVTPTEPYRLVVRSTGEGPNDSVKQLEAVLQKNFFDDLASTSAISMIGPAAGMTFQAGTGSPTYCGRDGGYEPGDPIPQTPPCTPDPNSPSGPSIGVIDPAALSPTGAVTVGSAKATLNPPPDTLTDLPDWQQSPADLDQFIQRLRTEAQNTGHYLPDTGQMKTLTQPNFGDRSTGTGLTFCEGSCQTTGNDTGGGILVVTGKFEYSGNMSFNGLIIVTGAQGMERKGAGNGQIIGNVVIAPYNANSLITGNFLPPQFTTSGGGNADIVFGGVSTAFDGTTAVTNLMLGVAEK